MLIIRLLIMNQRELLPSMICTAMMRVGTRMATVFDQHFADLGITQAQFRTLLAVWEAGAEEGISPSALADHLLLERATVTVLAARLVERGLLSRQAGENRRTFRLALTEDGQALLQRVLPRAVALADRTLAGRTLEELSQTWEMLRLIEERVRAYGDEEATAEGPSRTTKETDR